MRSSRQRFTVEQVAQFCLDVIRTRQKCGPYHFCGYSFGGLVAYEMAQQLRTCDHGAALVALLDTPNPALVKNLSQAASAKFRKTYVIDRLKKYTLHLRRGELRSLTSRGLAFVTSRAGQSFMPAIKGAFQIANRPLPAALKSNDPGFHAAWHSYTPNSHDQDIMCFRVEERGPEHADDPSMGWEACVKGKIQVHVVSGSHVDMMSAPAVIEISERLAAYLDPRSTLKEDGSCFN